MRTPWNKTPEPIVNAILEAARDPSVRVGEIACKFQVSEWLVGELIRKSASKELRASRYREACKQGKLGTKNPMFGKHGFKHHNAVPDVRCSGYKTVFAPSWWRGNTVKSNRIFEHIFVWCSYYGQDQLPRGCVVHHIDLDKDNNNIENLQLLSLSEHMTLHSEIRKVQRLERNLVGNSVPEAPGN